MLGERWAQVWDRLLAEGRAMRAHCLGHMLSTALERQVDSYAHGIILDLGAGTLPYRQILEKSGDLYVSLDIKVTHNEISCVGDGENLPFANDSFDTIFCSEVLEHIPHPWQALSEMGRVLRSGGYLIISTPFTYYLHGEPNDYLRFSHYAFRIWLSELGMDLIHSESIGGPVALTGIMIQMALLSIFYPIGWLRKPTWILNSLLSRIIAWLDKASGFNSKFPINFIVVALKK